MLRCYDDKGGHLVSSLLILQISLQETRGRSWLPTSITRCVCFGEGKEDPTNSPPFFSESRKGSFHDFHPKISFILLKREGRQRLDLVQNQIWTKTWPFLGIHTNRTKVFSLASTYWTTTLYEPDGVPENLSSPKQNQAIAACSAANHGLWGYALLSGGLEVGVVVQKGGTHCMSGGRGGTLVWDGMSVRGGEQGRGEGARRPKVLPVSPWQSARVWHGTTIPIFSSAHSPHLEEVESSLLNQKKSQSNSLKDQLEIWPQRPMYFAATITIHHSAARVYGDGCSEVHWPLGPNL